MIFSRITSAVTRFPWLVIAVWVVAAFGLASAGALKSADVVTDDQAQFLPSKYESAKALKFGQDAFGQVKGAFPVTVLVKRNNGGRIDARKVAAVTATLASWRPDWERIARPDGGIPHPNPRERATRVVGAQAGPVDSHGFQLVALTFKGNTSDPWVQAAFKQLRNEARHRYAAAGYRAGFTGGAASDTDYTDETRKTQQLGQLLLFGAAILLSAIFFRGVLAAIIPLATVVLVGSAAGGLVNLGAAATGQSVATNTPTLITVVLVGIGIDYFLFLMFRFREELRAGHGRKPAARGAAARIAPVIASAALAVVVAFATLALAQFGELRALGPAIALSVGVMLLAGVTLMPALLAVTGRALFWPSQSWRRERAGGFAARLGSTVARHPARVAIASAAALGVLSLGALGAKMNYDTNTTAKGTESARVSAEINRALPRGATDPQTVYVRSPHALTARELAPLAGRIAAVPGVAQVGTPTLNADRHAAQLPVVLRYDSFTGRAMDLAGGPLRDAAHAAAPRGTQVMAGGMAAIMADIRDSMSHDLRLIFPLAAGLILLILIVLLRSVVAPFYLLAAVGLEFAATLGASVWLFQDALDRPGVVFTLPLVLFLFVVALGTDYNMLASARLREEMLSGRPVRAAVADAVRHTAPAVGAAAAVLAASFGTLMVSHDQGTKQTGFAMALGILLAAVVVSTLLVPALTALVGRGAWWPSDRRVPERLAPPEPDPEAEPELAAV